MSTHSLTFHGQDFLLLPERALFWKDRRTLILSDVHLGKSAAFRIHGVPIPEGETDNDLSRISKLLAEYQAKHLLVVGDYIHSRNNHSTEFWTELSDWHHRQHISTTLIRGNHDPPAAQLSNLPNFHCQEALELDSIHFVHDPPTAGQTPTISGHLHPLCRLTQNRGASFRLPCFYLQGHNLILPAFGSFTSGSVVAAGQGEKLFPITEQKVFPLNSTRNKT